MEVEKLKRIQVDLKKRLVLRDGFSKIQKIGGVDISYSRPGGRAICAVVVLDYDKLEVVESLVIETKTSFPYVPTFFSFRESAPIIKTFKRLKEKPEVLLIDGQGIAHPRGLGLASHVGVKLDFPTIGVAKSVLVGEFNPPIHQGDSVIMSYENQVIGYAYKSKKLSNPIYVSPGHLVSLRSSLQIVKMCIKGNKLPEPLRLAHIMSKTASNKN
jgi:deoxyribonuclease V